MIISSVTCENGIWFCLVQDLAPGAKPFGRLINQKKLFDLENQGSEKEMCFILETAWATRSSWVQDQASSVTPIPMISVERKLIATVPGSGASVLLVCRDRKSKASSSRFCVPAVLFVLMGSTGKSSPCLVPHLQVLRTRGCLL